MKIGWRRYYPKNSTMHIFVPFSIPSFISLRACGGIPRQEKRTTPPPGTFMLMARSTSSWNLSETASCVGFGRGLMADGSVLLAGRTLDTVASGLQNGL